MSTILLTLILTLGGFLRFYNNTALALWHDEAFSALYLRYPWPEMMHRIGLDVHPPLYYLILRVWSYFAGQSLLSLRLLSILFGVLTIWAAYIFVKAAFHNKRLALMAALLVAVNPFQIQYALEARMYTLGTFLALWSSYFLVKALDSSVSFPSLEGRGKGRVMKLWIAYSITTVAALYTHYYLLFTILAQALYLLFYVFKSRNFKILFAGLGSYLLSVILYLPWLQTFLAQLSRVQGAYWIPAMDAWSVPGTVWKMTFGGGGAPRLWLAVTSVISVILIFYFLREVRGFAKWHIFFGLFIPFVAAIALSLRQNLYLDRYFVFASLYFSILVAVALYAIPRQFLRLMLIIALVSASVFAFFKNWEDLDIKNKPGMTAAAAYINNNAKASDKIYVGSSFIFFTFKYYNSTPVKPLLYSTAKVEKLPHFSGTAILTNQDLVMNFADAPRGDTVWLLWTTGFGASRPQVPTNWKQLQESAYQDAPGFKGSIYVTKYFVD